MQVMFQKCECDTFAKNIEIFELRFENFTSGSGKWHLPYIILSLVPYPLFVFIFPV